MAEKQFALGGTRSIGFHEEDDPLAELARIVGFQEPSANRSARDDERREPVITEFPVAPVQGAAQVAAGPNPVADLEDELLRAFETYDGPKAVSVEAPKSPASLEPFRQTGSSLEDDDDPFAALAAVVAQSESVSRAVPVRPAATAPVEPSFSDAPQAAPEPQVEFSVDLLEAELLQSLDEAELDWKGVMKAEAAEVETLPASPPTPAPAPAPTVRADFRMPLANFHAVGSATPARPAPAEPAPRMDPVAWDLPGEAAASRLENVAPSRPIAPSVVTPDAGPVSASGSNSGSRATDAYRHDPVFGASLAAISNVATEAAPMPSVERSYDFSADPTVAADEPDFDDLFVGGDFELDLDDFEQQLSDIAREARESELQSPTLDNARKAFAEFVAAEPSQAELAPVVPRVEPGPAAIREPSFTRDPLFQSEPPVARAEVKPAPVVAEQPQAVTAPIPSTPFSAGAISEPMDFDSEIFDPSLLSEAEDPVEAVADFNVPEIKMPEPEEPAVVVPDYDLDIDAEMANLFSSLPPLGATTAEKKPAAEAVPPRAYNASLGTGTATSAPVIESFDDFEKALEEDFRSMLSQPLGQAADPVSRAEPQMLPVSPPRLNNLRSILLAACATGAVALVGLGGYFMLSGKGGVIASGEPKVILADKGPVKVVPENKGGVTVPNQDKAVYDRVAGNGDEPVKQTALITSEEEPVDVVQKTLMPENMDDTEAEAPAVPTPVEDTKDARLLPAAEKPDNAEASNTPGGVQVRKVRTMIVKADGTLVPREEEPAPAAVESAPAAETTAAVPQERVLPEGNDTQASTDALAAVANTDVPNEAGGEVPVKPVKTSKLADTAPVPTARPSDQPVNVVGTVTENGKVKPDAPQETAALDPAAAKPATAPASGSYGIQIASLPSEADAKASIGKMSAKFGNVLGGRPISIRQANIPNKGTYYRLRVDVGSKDDAIALCSKLKAAGGSCLVSK